MTLTNFPNGISSLGIPTFGAGGLIPFPGNYWWVNETTGSDGNQGNDPAFPFKTLAQAQTSAVANNNDVVFVTGTIHTATTINWAKNWVHLIGLAAPSNNARARISATGSTVFTPLVNVTGEGCIIANLGTFHGFASATSQVCWNDSGGRNFYSNVEFFGGGNATAAAQAGMRSLTVDGDGENVFQNCTIGLDTIVRATGTNASLELLNGTPRNVFRNCIFQANVTNTADVHVTVGAGGMDRYALFDGCAFINAIQSGASTMAVAITANASAGGLILLNNPVSVGATVYATTGPVYITGAVPTATTSGLAILAT